MALRRTRIKKMSSPESYYKLQMSTGLLEQYCRQFWLSVSNLPYRILGGQVETETCTIVSVNSQHFLLHYSSGISNFLPKHTWITALSLLSSFWTLSKLLLENAFNFHHETPIFFILFFFFGGCWKFPRLHHNTASNYHYLFIIFPIRYVWSLGWNRSLQNRIRSIYSYWFNNYSADWYNLLLKQNWIPTLRLQQCFSALSIHFRDGLKLPYAFHNTFTVHF